jgi:N-acetylmuramoyl-L-alanine amidase
MTFMVVAAIPISGAVGDQNTNQNTQDPTSGLEVGVTNGDVEQAKSVIQDKKPFGENSNKILGTNNSDGKLRLGSTGDDVKKLQQWLTDYGYYAGDIDGVFGADTETAVKNFQEEAGLIVDGVVGNDTNKAMANWDKIVADVQAAGENDYVSETKNTETKATKTTKKQYTTAVRNYGKTYGNTRSYRGDCWDVSAAVYSQLTSSGQRARIIQYSNSYSPRHRSVQTWNGNTWVDYENVPWIGSPTARGSSETVITGN